MFDFKEALTWVPLSHCREKSAEECPLLLSRFNFTLGNCRRAEVHMVRTVGKLGGARNDSRTKDTATLSLVSPYSTRPCSIGMLRPGRKTGCSYPASASQLGCEPAYDYCVSPN